VNKPERKRGAHLRVHERLRTVTGDVHLRREQKIPVEVGRQLEIAGGVAQHAHRHVVQVVDAWGLDFTEHERSPMFEGLRHQGSLFGGQELEGVPLLGIAHEHTQSDRGEVSDNHGPCEYGVGASLTTSGNSCSA
jgi:hypothetical protein